MPWGSAIAGLSLFAIAAHLLLQLGADGAAAPLLRWQEFTVTRAEAPLLAIFLLGGLPLVLRIIRRLLAGNLGADFLGAIELVVAALLDQYLAAALIILMLSGGQALEAYAVRRASSVLRALAERMPSVAHRRRGAHIEDVPLSNIAIGDTILVLPHETAPVDGTVLEGHGSMDESYLTGEPYHVSKAPGAAVLSGAINGEAALTIRAEKIAEDSRYAQIMQVMQEAEQKRPKLRRMADQLGGAFAIFALIAGGLTWLVTGDALRFLSVLVIATPCPLIIAIPVTMMGAISLAAKRGILIKDPTVLERLPTCRTAIFDKTGTLTYGQPELTEILTAPGIQKESILQHVASLERYSKHPLSRAILTAAQSPKLALLEAVQLSEKPGQGLTGSVGGHEFLVTHRKHLAASMPAIAAQLPPTMAGLECVVLRDGQYAATFRFRDTPRVEGKSFISHLGPAHQFTKVMLVSGDRASEVEYLAGLLGIKEPLAAQSPEQKVAIVRAETAKAPTIFMGDGINDAPALAAATVGIAFGQHSNVTSAAAGAVIMEHSLVKVDELLHISTRLRRIALQSAVGGMALSIVGMGFAAAGMVTPVMGALIQEMIDVLAILSALRLIWGVEVKTDLNSADSPTPRDAWRAAVSQN